MNGIFLFTGILNIIALLLLITLPIYCFIKIRKDITDEGHKILWVLIVVLIPLLGPIAYLLTRPRE